MTHCILLFVLRRSKGSVETMSNTTAVQFKAATLHLYADNDLVSQSIANSSTWEATEVENVLWALQQPIPQQQQQQGQQPQAPLFVDIGANVGVFSVNAAAAGARVAAFEGEQCMRTTACCRLQSSGVLCVNLYAP
jgi:2-polyprenyl-3-methyl-5-hydroxy-6-metoxy-1,4-benzoquinol methylase